MASGFPLRRALRYGKSGGCTVTPFWVRALFICRDVSCRKFKWELVGAARPTWHRSYADQMRSSKVRW